MRLQFKASTTRLPSKGSREAQYVAEHGMSTATNTFCKCETVRWWTVHISIITSHYGFRLKVIATIATGKSKHTFWALFLVAYDFTGTLAIPLSHCGSDLQSIRGTSGLLRKSSRAKDLKGRCIILQVQCGFRGACLTLAGDNCKELQTQPRISVEGIL